MGITHFIKKSWARFRFKNIIKNEFDINYYLSNNNDVREMGVDPIMHFIDNGWKEGRNPNALFSTSYYLENNPDVYQSNQNPFIHFLLFGINEGRESNPQGIPYFSKKTHKKKFFTSHSTSKRAKEIEKLRETLFFDKDYYLENNPDIAESKLDPVLHYYDYGWKENRKISSAIDIDFLIRMYPQFIQSNTNPITKLLNDKTLANIPRTVDLYLNKSDEPMIVFLINSELNKTTEKYLLQLFDWLKNSSKIAFKIIIWDNEIVMSELDKLYNCLFISENDDTHFSSTQQKIKHFCAYRTKLIYTVFHLDKIKSHLFNGIQAPFLLHINQLSDLPIVKDKFTKKENLYKSIILNNTNGLHGIRKNENNVFSAINNTHPITCIISTIRKTAHIKPWVSIIVPNYNYSKYLKKRIDSILDQTFKDFELIIIDDRSTDESVDVIKPYLNHPFVKFFQNKKNSGSVIHQWRLGVEKASGDFVWIAEADDFCSLDFLEKTIQPFADRVVNISYSNSVTVDENDKITGDYESYYSRLNTNHWNNSYAVYGNEEVNFGLGVKNTIPNASAVLFRRIPLFNILSSQMDRFVLSGDWNIYLKVLGKNSKIAFCSEKLNCHRKHNQTVTSKSTTNNKQLIIDELNKIHQQVFNSFELSNQYYLKWKNHVAGQIMGLYPSIQENSFNDLYPYDKNIQLIKLNIERHNENIIIIASNDSDLSGAPQNILSVARILNQKFGFKCITFCLRKGELFTEFEKCGEAYIADDYGYIPSKNQSISEFILSLNSKPIYSLVNTIVTSVWIPQLKRSFIPIAFLIHDYTHSIDKKRLQYSYELSDIIIYSVDFMIEKNRQDYKFDLNKTSTLPQGLYKEEFLLPRSEDDRRNIRKLNRIPDDAIVVIGCGSVNTRKGVDIFVNIAINVLSSEERRKEVHFIWLGGEIGTITDNEYSRYLYRDIVNSGFSEHIHFIKGTSNVKPYFDASDVFILSSREDPFPTVVQEAIASGLIVAGFEGTGGAIELIRKANGFVFPFLKTDSAVQKIIEISNNLNSKYLSKKEIILNEYNFYNYVDKLNTLITEQLSSTNKPNN
jgi:glycosyltransferase involved in cell wall biosynthesis